MKFQTIIDKACEEKVLIYAKQRTKPIEDIESYISNIGTELLGYDENRDTVKLSASEIYCFIVEENKIYALTDSGKFRINQRLYEIEELVSADFVKINQSCLCNIHKISKFGASLGGSLTVILKNGYKDYISRRQVKTVKERIGLK